MMKKLGLAFLLLALVRPAFAVVEMSSWLSYKFQNAETLDRYGENFTSIAVFAYDFDADDNLRPARPWVDAMVNDLMENRFPGRPVYITIVNDIETTPPQQHNGELVLRILSDPVKRAEHIRQLVAISANADGIEIDYESLLAGTRPYFSLFIKELREALPAGKLLAVDCQPKTNNLDGSRGQAFDWEAIHPYVDVLKVMTYYYSFGTSDPGPSSPLDRIFAVTRLAQSQIPAEKLHMVLTQFGWDWPNDAPGSFISYVDAMKIAEDRGVRPFRDFASRMLRVNYIDDGGVPHQIWFPDENSLQAQINLIQSLGVDKIDVWELGAGDPRFWEWTANNTINPGKEFPIPALNEVFPSSAVAGSAAMELTVNGAGFMSGSVVRWNGNDRVTSFVSRSTLTVIITARDIASAGVSTLTVFNGAPGGGGSGGQAFTVLEPHPVPVLSSLAPRTVVEGGAGFTLTLTGSNFINDSIVQWNGADRETTFVSDTQMTAAILAGDVASGGVSTVTVFNPAPGGGNSGSQLFIIENLNPVPVLSRLAPSTLIEGAAAFTLTLTGSNFVSGSIVQWNGAGRVTAFISETQLTAEILASDVASVGVSTVSIFTPAPGGGSSGGQSFSVLASNPVPELAVLNPASTTSGSAAFSLTVTGSNFVNASVVRWNGAGRATTFVSPTRLTAAISGADISSVGISTVAVFNPGPGGGLSGRLIFTIKEAPVLSNLGPGSATRGGPDFTLTVTGLHFDNDVIVQWDGVNKPTTFVSSTQVTAVISAIDISIPGLVEVTVVAADGKVSNIRTIEIKDRQPEVNQRILDLTQARVFPNPWSANRHGGANITFDRLTQDATVKIFTISATWIKSLTQGPEGALWDLTNDDGDSVASGYYIYLITDPEGNETRGKVAIVK